MQPLLVCVSQLLLLRLLVGKSRLPAPRLLERSKDYSQINRRSKEFSRRDNQGASRKEKPTPVLEVSAMP